MIELSNTDTVVRDWLERIAGAALNAQGCRWSSEADLHDAVYDCVRPLDPTGIVRERRLSSGRADIWVPGIAIEVKVGGSPAAVLRQLQKYADDPEVLAIVLVTTRVRHGMPAQLPDRRGGGWVPVRTVVVMEPFGG